MSFTQDFFTSRRNYGDGATRIERPGVLWYHSDDNTIRVGDGVTPGGIILTGGGTLPLPNDVNITGNLSVAGNTQLTGNLVVNGNTNLNGNVGLGNNSGDTINIFGQLEGDLIPSQTGVFDIGKPDKQWRNLNVTQFYNGNILIDDNRIQTTNSNSNLELRVNGSGVIDVGATRISNLATPIDAKDAVTKEYLANIIAGPMEVQNVLYVSMSGSDTLDGKTLSTTKRTIKGAVAIATYGTCIFVKSGDYTELNPITVPEGVSIVGDNLRSVTVRPYNKKQDLFWVKNGVYLAHMTFKDHESPAAAVAFPPDGSAGAIHTSPYVQNCTSMTTTGTGLRIDGNHVEGLKSFVVDAYTQYNQGGIGVHHLNMGNSQLVSVFTICCDIAILAESGGFCSLANSNSSFGNVGLKADGVSKVLYTGKTNGAQITNRTILIDNLYKLPNIGDAVKFAGDPAYYTVISTNGLHPLSDGTSEIIGPNYSNQAGDRKNTRNRVLDIKQKIQIDTIDFINETFVNLSYDQFKCTRDVGLIIDAVVDDMMFGTNYKSVLAGSSYQRVSASKVANQQLAETISAVNFVKNSVLQEIANDSTQGIEYNLISNNFNTIINILTNGAPAIPALTYPDPVNVDVNKTKAKNILQANRSFLMEEGIAFITANIPSLFYDQVKCARDVGLILNAVLDDVIFNTNHRSITAGLSYLRSYASTVTQSQKSKTLAGIAKTRDLAIAIINDSTTQSELTARFQNVINIINTGLAPTTTFTNPVSDIISGASNSAAILQANKNYIKDEIIAYINDNYVGFVYTPEFQTKCERDVTYILNAAAYDMALNTNYGTITAGLAYIRANADYVKGEQRNQTINAIKKARDLSLALMTDNTAKTIFSNNVDKIIDIFLNGIGSVVPIVYNHASPSQSRLNAKNQLQLNKEFIKADIIEYVNDYYPSLTYNQVKCSRDVGYIIDALCYDILYGTNTATIIAAESYFVGTFSQLGLGETPATIDAYTRLKLTTSQVAQGLVVTPTPGVILSQDWTTYNGANATQGTEIADLVQIIIDVLNAGNVNGLPAKVYPDTTWSTPSLHYDRQAVTTAIPTIKTQVSQFVSYSYSGFTYNTTKCARDIGYILNAMTYDLLYGGNSETYLAAESYYYNGNTVTPNQEQIHAEVFTHMSSVIKKIIQNIPVTNTVGNMSAQVLGASPGTLASANYLETLHTLLIDYIVDGNSLITKTYVDYTKGVDYSTQNSYRTAILAQESTIKSDVIAYLGPAVYDDIKCKRDIGYVIDAVCYDIIYGGNSQTADAADEYYSGGTLQVPASERQATADTFTYVKNIAKSCVVNTVVTPLQNVVIQNTSLPAASGAEVTRVDDLFSIVDNLIENAYTSRIEVFPSMNGITDNLDVTFHQFSLITTSGHTLQWIGAGINVNTALPYQGGIAIQENEVIELNYGKVNFTSTDQEGDFRIGEDLVINRRLGTISGRAFTKSLFAVVTPYILAIGE